MSDPSVSYPIAEECIPRVDLRAQPYRACFAQTLDDVEAVQRLRYDVFNLELDEGLDGSHEIGRDVDVFDTVCHHLLVVDTRDESVVGTYRMQTYDMASNAHGLYSAQEFDFSGWPQDVLDDAVELGRACIAKAHRSLPVLNLLWRGIGTYLRFNACRYLLGCSSLTSQDPREGVAMLRYFADAGLLHPTLRVEPREGYRCAVEGDVEPATRADVPRLMRVYINTGARICGPPALDRAFKTIDFLAFFDVDALDPKAARFFGIEA